MLNYYTTDFHNQGINMFHMCTLVGCEVCAPPPNPPPKKELIRKKEQKKGGGGF